MTVNNIITNWDNILTFGQSYGWPKGKSRGKLREYLQSRFILKLYQLPAARKLSFIGGTSLRLLRGIGRFSEDLDFDIVDASLTHDDVDHLIQAVLNSFQRENIQVELSTTHKNSKNYYNVKFPNILLDLGISSNPKEKLTIKFDYTSNWKDQKREALIFNRFGGIERVVTNTLDTILVQKLAAYVNRPQTQPRDMYDIVWLHTQLAKYDQMFAKANGFNQPDLLFQAHNKFEADLNAGKLPKMKQRLQPFLFDEQEVHKIELLGDVLHTMSTVAKT